MDLLDEFERGIKRVGNIAEDIFLDPIKDSVDFLGDLIDDPISTIKDDLVDEIKSSFSPIFDLPETVLDLGTDAIDFVGDVAEDITGIDLDYADNFRRDNDTYANTLNGQDWGTINPDGTLTIDKGPHAGTTFNNANEAIQFLENKGDSDQVLEDMYNFYNQLDPTDPYAGQTTNGSPASGKGEDINPTQGVGNLAAKRSFEDIASFMGVENLSKPEQAKQIFSQLTGDAPESLSKVQFGENKKMQDRLATLVSRMEGIGLEDTTKTASNYLSAMGKGIPAGAATATGKGSALGTAESSMASIANKLTGQLAFKKQAQAIEDKDAARAALVNLKNEILSSDISREDAFRRRRAKAAIGLTGVQESARMQAVMESKR